MSDAVSEAILPVTHQASEPPAGGAATHKTNSQISLDFGSLDNSNHEKRPESLSGVWQDQHTTVSSYDFGLFANVREWQTIDE